MLKGKECKRKKPIVGTFKQRVEVSVTRVEQLVQNRRIDYEMVDMILCHVALNSRCVKSPLAISDQKVSRFQESRRIDLIV